MDKKSSSDLNDDQSSTDEDIDNAFLMSHDAFENDSLIEGFDDNFSQESVSQYQLLQDQLLQDQSFQDQSFQDNVSQSIVSQNQLSQKNATQAILSQDQFSQENVSKPDTFQVKFSREIASRALSSQGHSSQENDFEENVPHHLLSQSYLSQDNTQQDSLSQDNAQQDSLSQDQFSHERLIHHIPLRAPGELEPPSSVNFNVGSLKKDLQPTRTPPPEKIFVKRSFLIRDLQAFSNTYSKECTVSWHNLDVYVKEGPLGFKKKPNHILRNVSGEAPPRNIMAIMGSSGAGKTTFLNCLTGRNLKRNKVYGSVRINGRRIGNKMSHVSAYIQQHDMFVGTLKVREHLIFQAHLKMHPRIKNKDRLKRVEEVLIEFGLAKCADTMIGVPGRIKGISGGEMKRLSFAAEVLTNPSIFFCDEPTSGLDSFMTHSIISVMKYLATRGKTIICTIHQPSSQVYDMFDMVLFLANGRLAYLGPTKEATSFFSNIGYHCPKNYNPADFIIETLSIVRGKEEESKHLIARVCDDFKASQILRTSKEIFESMDAAEMDQEFACQAFLTSYKASWFKQFRMIFWRSLINLKRDPVLTTARIFQTIVTSLLLGTIYYQQKIEQGSIMNINGILFIMIMSMSFVNLFAVITILGSELPLFLRENGNGMYRSDVYFLSKSLAEMPTFIIVPILFTTITYWMVGLREDFNALLNAMVVLIIVTQISVSYGYFISAVTGDPDLATNVGPASLIPIMMFGGFFMRSDKVPIYFKWIQDISWFYYGFSALSVNQWKPIKFPDCPQKVPNVEANQTIPIHTCVSDGETILKQFNFNEDDVEKNIYMLLILFVGYRFIALIAVMVKAKVSG